MTFVYFHWPGMFQERNESKCSLMGTMAILSKLNITAAPFCYFLLWKWCQPMLFHNFHLCPIFWLLMSRWKHDSYQKCLVFENMLKRIKQILTFQWRPKRSHLQASSSLRVTLLFKEEAVMGKPQSPVLDDTTPGNVPEAHLNHLPSLPPHNPEAADFPFNPPF